MIANDIIKLVEELRLLRSQVKLLDKSIDEVKEAIVNSDYKKICEFVADKVVSDDNQVAEVTDKDNYLLTLHDVEILGRRMLIACQYEFSITCWCIEKVDDAKEVVAEKYLNIVADALKEIKHT